MGLRPGPEDITILNGLTSAPTPPTYNSGNGWGAVPHSWSGGAVEEFDLEVHADAANAVTVAKLVAGTPETQVLADDAVESIASNELTLTSHAYETGDGPVRFTTSGTLPTGLAANTDYWVIDTGTNTIKIADSLYAALTNQPIQVSGGSGTHTIVDVTTGDKPTARIKWLSQGFLGEAGDGAVTLTALMGYRVRVQHSQKTAVYALVATFGSAVATYAKIVPQAPGK